MMGGVEGGDEEEEASQLSYKLVPWFAWDEWNFVRNSIFSSSPTSPSAALARVTTWRSRGGCLPCPVEVTASLVEAQQRDPFFRPDLPADCANSDEMLSMTYCMAIMRLVNGFVEKTRKKNGPSISQSAERIGIPRMLVDIRHECSHRQLPSLALSRMASTVALDWLKAYYWEPQRKAIPNIRKEVKFKLREMASYLNAKQTQNEDPSLTKSSKRQISTTTKSITRLFEGCPLDVVTVLVERFQKVTRKSGIMKSKEDSCSPLADTGQAGENSGKVDVWKDIVVRLSKKEPALLLAVIESLIKMIEDQSIWKSDHDERSPVQHLPEAHQDDTLSLLIEHLLEMMKAVKCSDANGCDQRVFLPALNKTRLWQLLSKCLLVSPGNKHLINCAIILGQIIGEDSVVEKLEKLLPVLGLPGPDSVLQDAGFTEAFSIFQQHKDSLTQSAKQLESLKQCQSKTFLSSRNIVGETQSKTWMVSKAWSPAPIGMLPYSFGQGETLPIFVKADNLEKVTISSQNGLLDPERSRILGKREPSCDAEQLKSVCGVKKIRDEGDTSLSVDVDNSNLQSLEGHLMIAGSWKKLEKDQLLELESRVKILV